MEGGARASASDSTRVSDSLVDPTLSDSEDGSSSGVGGKKILDVIVSTTRESSEAQSHGSGSWGIGLTHGRHA